jgi:GNAT superfamily N-acetyltransferase
MALAPWPTPLTAAHVPDAAALLAEAYAHRAHEPERWGWRSPNDEQRWIVEAPDASVAAYLALWRVQTTQFRMDLIVRPSSRREGLGARLLEFLIDRAREAHATSLQARPYADSTDALSLLAGREFRETMRMIGLELNDVGAVSLPPVVSLEGQLAARGIRLTTLADELNAYSRGWEKLRDTHQAARFGWPDPDPRPDGKPHEPETVDEFRTRSEAVGVIPDACFIAADADRYVAYSALTVIDEARRQAGSGGTAVRPEYRGLGIATLLKSRCVHWAQEHGSRRLATCSGNPAMIRVNEKLGFLRTYVEVRLVKRLV